MESFSADLEAQAETLRAELSLAEKAEVRLATGVAELESRAHEAGRVRKGEKVIIMPTKTETTVECIFVNDNWIELG